MRKKPTTETLTKKSDPTTFAEMSKPHESREAFIADLKAFHAEMSELRKKHKIANIVSVINSPYLADGQPTDGFIVTFFGDSRNELPMLAQAFGNAKAQHDALIEKLSRGEQ